MMVKAAAAFAMIAELASNKTMSKSEKNFFMLNHVLSTPLSAHVCASYGVHILHVEYKIIKVS